MQHLLNVLIRRFHFHSQLLNRGISLLNRSLQQLLFLHCGNQLLV